MDHRNEANMVKDAGLTYESNDEGERVISRPVCAEFGDSIQGKVGTVQSRRRTCDMRKAIGKHLQGRMHVDALEEREKELRKNMRRTRICLNVTRNVCIHCERDLVFFSLR
jgi:hypothetical protein